MFNSDGNYAATIASGADVDYVSGLIYDADSDSLIVSGGGSSQFNMQILEITDLGESNNISDIYGGTGQTNILSMIIIDGEVYWGRYGTTDTDGAVRYAESTTTAEDILSSIPGVTDIEYIIPEPATIFLPAMCLVALLLKRRKRK